VCQVLFLNQVFGDAEIPEHPGDRREYGSDRPHACFGRRQQARQEERSDHLQGGAEIAFREGVCE
jgi:hypothetical protein